MPAGRGAGTATSLQAARRTATGRRSATGRSATGRRSTAGRKPAGRSTTGRKPAALGSTGSAWSAGTFLLVLAVAGHAGVGQSVLRRSRGEQVLRLGGLVHVV